MILLDVVSLIVVLANLILGIFVLIKGPIKKAKIIFAFLALVIAGWIATNWFTYLFLDYSLISIFGKLTYVFAILIPPLFLLFIYFFFSGNSRLLLDRIVILISWIAGAIFTFISISTRLIDKKPLIIRPHVTTVDHGSVYPLFFVYFILFMVYAFYMLIRRFHDSNGVEKQRIRYILLGFGISGVIGNATNLLGEATIQDLYLRAMVSFVGPISAIFMVIAIFYSIVKYRFLDIKLFIRKGVVHFISIAIILFTYLYLLIFVQQYLVKQYNWSLQTTTVLLILVIVLTIEPLRRFLFKVVDRVFYSKQRTSREESRRLRQIMSSSMQFDLLINRLTSELSQSLNVPKTIFLWNNKQIGVLENYQKNGKSLKYNSTDPLYQFIRDNTDVLVTEEIPYLIEDSEADKAKLLQNIERELKKDHIGLVLPIGERGELVGALMMEPRKKKDAFTSDDVEYLSGLQFQMTGAIANALLYKQAVERIASFSQRK